MILTNIEKSKEIIAMPYDKLDRLSYEYNMKDFLITYFIAKNLSPKHKNVWNMVFQKDVSRIDYFRNEFKELQSSGKKVFIYNSEYDYFPERDEMSSNKIQFRFIPEIDSLSDSEMKDLISKIRLVYNVFETENEIHLFGIDIYYFGDELDKFVLEGHSLQNYYGTDFFKIDFDKELVSNTEYTVYATKRLDFYISRELADYINNNINKMLNNE